MKKLLFTLFMGMAVLIANGQQKQGKVLYERTVQMQMAMRAMPAGAAEGPALPSAHKDKVEVFFGNDQSIRRRAEEDLAEEVAREEGGMHIRMMVADGNDLTYSHFQENKVVEQKEFGAKNYIIADSIHKLNWKLTGQTTTILNYPCQQAVTQKIGKRTMTRMENGDMKTEEVADTSNIIAWFTTAIPVPAGPDFQGQLPGLILGIDVNNGRTVYKAVELSAEVDLATIKAPSKGKKVTAAEFENERRKVMAEMQRNNGGGRMIRISQ
jgi:GLPGLI family protein